MTRIEKQAALRTFRRENGLCYTCGDPAKTDPGGKRYSACPDCLRRRRKDPSKERPVKMKQPPAVERDHTGQTFGRLTVKYVSTRPGNTPYWFCLCKCGTEKEIRSDHVKSGNVVSCGCAREGPQEKSWTRKGNTAPRVVVEAPVEPPPPPPSVITGKVKRITLSQYEQSVRAFIASGFPKAEAREMALMGHVVEESA